MSVAACGLIKQTNCLLTIIYLTAIINELPLYGVLAPASSLEISATKAPSLPLTMRTACCRSATTLRALALLQR